MIPSFGMIYEPLMAQNRFDGTRATAMAGHIGNLEQRLHPDHFQAAHRCEVERWRNRSPLLTSSTRSTCMKQYPALDTAVSGRRTPPQANISFNSVTALDDSTVVMTFNQNASVYEWYFAAQTPIVAQHTFSKLSNPGTDLNSQPVGTGPYVLSSFSPSLITLTANPNYWQKGLPKIKTLKYPAFDSNTSAEVVLNNSQIDWAGVAYPNIKQWPSANSNNHYFYAPTNVVELYLNLQKAPFNDLRLPQGDECRD